MLAVFLSGVTAAATRAQNAPPENPPEPAPDSTPDNSPDETPDEPPANLPEEAPKNARPAPPPPGSTGLSDLEKLRIENEELKRKVASLERELATARNTIATIRKPRDGERPGATAAPRAEIPADPLASPASMLADLKKKYQTEFGAMQDPKDDASLRLKSQRWTREAEKQARGKASWLVRFSRVEQMGQGQNATTRATTLVLDPETMTPIGDQFTMDVPTRLAQRVTKAQPDEVWQLSLTMAPRLKFNPLRAEMGTLDVPPFVGKYIELEPDYIWEALVEAKGKKPAP